MFTERHRDDRVALLEYYRLYERLTLDSTSAENSHPRYGIVSCAWPPAEQADDSAEDEMAESDMVEVGSPCLDAIVSSGNFRCAACNAQLILEDVLGFGGIIALGEGIEVIKQKLARQPYACPECTVNFCGLCAVGEATRQGINGYACPFCKATIGIGDTRPRITLKPSHGRKSHLAQNQGCAKTSAILLALLVTGAVVGACTIFSTIG